MTSREIGQSVGRSERRVEEWAKGAGAKTASIGAKIAEARKAGKAADYDLDETCLIIEMGLGKNAAGIYRANALRAPAAGDKRLDRLEVMVSDLVKAVCILTRQHAPEKRLSEPPELSPREALRKLVEGWARDHGRCYHEAWSNLYREYGYRYRQDIVRAAKNRGMSVLDYAEEELCLGQLMVLAYYLYGQKEPASEGQG